MNRLFPVPVFTGIIALLQFASGVAAAQESPRSRVPDVAGTYSVAVCRDSCSASAGQVLVEGTLVIEEQPYSIIEIPEPARTYFEKFTTLLLHLDAETTPNACFVFSPGKATTLAGIRRVGLTKWTRETGDTLAIRLHRSADAGYDARLSISPEALVGRGESWGPWDESQNPPLDHVVATRIGPPDRDLCMRAAERRLAELRR